MYPPGGSGINLHPRLFTVQGLWGLIVTFLQGAIYHWGRVSKRMEKVTGDAPLLKLPGAWQGTLTPINPLVQGGERPLDPKLWP